MYNVSYKRSLQTNIVIFSLHVRRMQLSKCLVCHIQHNRFVFQSSWFESNINILQGTTILVEAVPFHTNPEWSLQQLTEYQVALSLWAGISLVIHWNNFCGIDWQVVSVTYLHHKFPSNAVYVSVNGACNIQVSCRCVESCFIKWKLWQTCFSVEENAKEIKF